MRERLIELLDKVHHTHLGKEYLERLGTIADYLLANGVIVPPCKVGDTVYVINDREVEKTTVFSMKIESTDSHWMTFVKAKIIDHDIKFEEGHWYMFKAFVFGKTAFPTREEAEKALKKEEK